MNVKQNFFYNVYVGLGLIYYLFYAYWFHLKHGFFNLCLYNIYLDLHIWSFNENPDTITTVKF